MSSHTTPQLITDNLDLWTTAITKRSATGRGSNKKIELTGIKKLRELILELAVRGKLVPQDPNDEPASVLLEKIAAEKAQLIKDKKIKKPKVLPEIGEKEKPFELPMNWEWIRLGDLTNYGSSDKVEARNTSPDTWVLELEDVEKGTSKLLKKIRFSERQFKSSKNRFSKGDVIYGKLRPYLDKVLVTDEDGVCTTEMIPLRAYSSVKSNFLCLLMKSPYFINYANNSTHGMNLPRMGTDKARLAILPLVPELEQHRIVAKVDELMGLCDQLEQQTEDSITAHQTLVETLLATLSNSETPAAFKQNWIRIAEHFDTLFTTEHSIDQLKQTLLQLAVMGKLVPQNPNDEPASVLLEKIAAEKEQLIKDKKIKKQKPLPAITEDEKPFELPNGWEFCRLVDLIPQFQNGASSRGDSNGKEIIVLRLADIKDWQVSMSDTRSISINEKSIERYLLQQGDILIIRVNGSADIVGRFIACHENYSAIYCDHFIRMRFPIECFSAVYLSLLGSSALRRERINDLFVSTAGQKTVNQTHIGSLCVSLPPLAEQHRIIKKVDELITLCDQLKTRLSDSQETQLHLADTIVEQAVS